MEERNFKLKDMFISTLMLLYFIGAIVGGILVILTAAVNVRHGLQIDPRMYIIFASYICLPVMATALSAFKRR